MLETLHKISALFKTSHFPLFLFEGFLSTKVIIEKREEDQTPGDNFPHVFMK
jgi:hypothetical protein